jgi:RNA polymerase sigma-70 factor (ECF subfamily)
MKRLGVLVVVTVLAWGAMEAQAADKPSVKNKPPVVVRTVPQSGDTAVDPSLGELQVTFSKDMMTEDMWSWVMESKETFPTIAGKVRYLDDKRTCVAPVKLEPGKTYVIWINSQRFNSFRDTGNRPAIPYLLVFETRK